jgi:hypothetical protein
MDKEQRKKQPPVGNSDSDYTGPYDLRLGLWRPVCAQYHMPVGTLASQLRDDQ